MTAQVMKERAMSISTYMPLTRKSIRLNQLSKPNTSFDDGRSWDSSANFTSVLALSENFEVQERRTRTLLTISIFRSKNNSHCF